ncbi:antitoxin [Shinella zoogloeoides]|uniref:antitoxin n=1 Tax=Shinella zoogloeoides TaxID=352475 RepID=UPI00273FC74B|nr:AbrB/MazE/SpoVT family DNA-binding domain-containing protein [Shinella zoogloeoides]WLR93773.1 AbrB/MazE/SpoVT family DNA-binding domain-containing protein [Shinella zoogloeoides]
MNARPQDVTEAAQEREVKLFRNGRNQAVRIPVEFELPGNEAVMRKEGDRLILEPKPRKMGLAALLATFEPWEGEFPELDETTPPPEDVEL